MAIGDPSTQGEPLVITNAGPGTINTLTFGHPDVIIINRPTTATGKLTINLPLLPSSQHHGYGHLTIVSMEHGVSAATVDIGPANGIKYSRDAFTISGSTVTRSRTSQTAVRTLTQGSVVSAVYVATIRQWIMYGDSDS